MTSAINFVRMVILGLLLFPTMKSNGQSMNNKLRSEINDRANTIAAKAKEMDIERDPGAIGDCYIYLQRMEAFQELRISMLQHWKIVFDDLNAFARDEYVTTLIVLALRDMPADEYVTFLNRTLDLTMEKKLSPRMMEWALYPAAGPNMALLTNSYRDERVRAVMVKAKRVFFNNPQIVAGLDERLSGRAKTERDDFVKRLTRTPADRGMATPSSPAPPRSSNPIGPASKEPAARGEGAFFMVPWVLGGVFLVIVIAVIFSVRRA